MRMKPFIVLTGSALVGLAAACLATLIQPEPPPELPPNVFVSADQEGLVELPEEPKPLAAETPTAEKLEPPSLAILGRPEAMPALMDGREVTVAHRQPEEKKENYKEEAKEEATEQLMRLMPARKFLHESGMGRLRRASFFVDGKRAYVLEDRSGQPMYYVTAAPNLDLEPYVHHQVNLVGSAVYRGDLRSNYMEVIGVAFARHMSASNSQADPVLACEAPPSPELAPMPTEEPADEAMTLPRRGDHGGPVAVAPTFPLSQDLVKNEADKESTLPAPVPAPVAAPVPTVPGPISDPPTPIMPQYPPSNACPVFPAKTNPLPLPAIALKVSRSRVSARSESHLLVGGHPRELRVEQDHSQLNLLEGEFESGQAAEFILYAGLAPDQKCLWIYSSAGVARLIRCLEQSSDDDETTVSHLRVCLGRLVPLKCRVVDVGAELALSRDLTEAAKLDKDVVLIGVRDHWELWDAKKWREYSQEPNQKTTELLEESSKTGPIEEQPSRLTPEHPTGIE